MHEANTHIKIVSCTEHILWQQAYHDTNLKKLYHTGILRVSRPLRAILLALSIAKLALKSLAIIRAQTDTAMVHLIRAKKSVAV